MARIKVGGYNNFTPIPEGRHTFQIVDVKYKEDFGKLEIHCENSRGRKHREFFSFLKANGEDNDIAYQIFAWFATTIMQDDELEDVDPYELVGRYFSADVTHEEVESTKEPGRMFTNLKLRNWKAEDSFEDGSTGIDEDEEDADDVDLDADEIDLDDLFA